MGLIRRQLSHLLLPAPIRRQLKAFLERRRLEALPRLECELANVGELAELRDLAWLSAPETSAAWETDSLRLERLQHRRNLAGGVNPGDGRALYFLVRRLDATRVLEIGTHVGASTAHLATAMNSSPGRERRIDTVDIVDVNDPVHGPWRGCGAAMSPAAAMAELGAGELVRFHVSDATGYLTSTTTDYDLIFLDGDHSAPAVYREIQLACRRLAPGGLLLLHDYFPDLQPLWSTDPKAGPYLGVARHIREGKPFDILPLGELPWPTKEGSRRTSLALLGRA